MIKYTYISARYPGTEQGSRASYSRFSFFKETIRLCSHAGSTKGLTEQLFRELSVMAIFQRSLFFSPYLPHQEILIHVFLDRSHCLAKNMNPPSCSHRLDLDLCALPRHPPCFLAIARSTSCTCSQRLGWKHTPPILIVASLSSSVIMSKLQNTLWPLVLTSNYWRLFLLVGMWTHKRA